MSPVSVDLVQVSGLLVCHEFIRYLGLVYVHFLSTEQLLYVANNKVRSKYSKPFETRNVSFVYLEYSLYFGVGKAVFRYYLDSLQTVEHTSQRLFVHLQFIVHLTETLSAPRVPATLTQVLQFV